MVRGTSIFTADMACFLDVQFKLFLYSFTQKWQTFDLKIFIVITCLVVYILLYDLRLIRYDFISQLELFHRRLNSASTSLVGF